MTDIIQESVKKLEHLLHNCGCEDGDVFLDVNPDACLCRYEQGSCMTATFGGKTAEYATFEPLRARTRISFMFGAPFDTAPARCAACAVMNVTAGFFCLNRTLRACEPSSHERCYNLFAEELANNKVFCIGTIPRVGELACSTIVQHAEDAEVILIGAEGIVAPGTGNIIDTLQKTKRIICIGPSTAGIARLLEIEHWCPFGKS